MSHTKALEAPGIGLSDRTAQASLSTLHQRTSGHCTNMAADITGNTDDIDGR